MVRIYNVTWTHHTYQLDWKANDVAICLKSGANYQHNRWERTGSLSAEIKTKELLIRSISEQDTPFFVKIFGDPRVMRLFAGGQVLSEAVTTQRIQGWSKRWFQKQDPYSAMLICKDETPIGYVVVGHGNSPGVSEPAMALLSTEWKKGYGKDVVNALQEWVFALKKEEFLLEGKSLEKVASTVSKENVASEKLLQAIGMQYTGNTLLAGVEKRVYEREIKIPEFVEREINAAKEVSIHIDHVSTSPVLKTLRSSRWSRFLTTLSEWKANIISKITAFLSYLKGRLFRTV